MNRKRGISLLICLLAVLLIRLFCSSQVRVETYYSTSIYPRLSGLLRTLLGWLPFSFGDILYGLLIIWMLFRLIRFGKQLYKSPGRLKLITSKWYTLSLTLLLLYLIFNLFWGINYNRTGIARQLQLPAGKYSKEELMAVDSLLAGKVNDCRNFASRNPGRWSSSEQIFEMAVNAYHHAAAIYPFLQYQPSSVKSSLWGWAGNYIGFTGYYNPFTGESQVNTTVPKFLQPYTTCHEIAHQLGYAKENEANFAGYLAAVASGDSTLLYSTYLDLFLYTQQNLARADTTAARYFAAKLSAGVKADLKEWETFARAHESPVEPVFKWLYGMYLSNNQQPSGILTYNEVTAFLIAYYKKFGRL